LIGTVTLADGTAVAALGQGTWRMGEGHRSRRHEADALRLGMDLGMTLIDTAEMYADGGAEEVVAEALAGRRDEAFVVSKVVPSNASRRGVMASCEASLKRLGIETIDLYLLHWPGRTPIAETIEAFETLCAEGKIARWGVSNFDVNDLDQMQSVPHGDACGTNQVLYNLHARGIEFDLLPWCAAQKMPVMAYSPVGQGGLLLKEAALLAVANRHHATPAQIATAWTLRLPGVISIPKASDPEHIRENAAAAKLRLTEQDLAELDAAFPPPARAEQLGML